MTIRWKCGYGQYEAQSGDYEYMVTKQLRRSEPMWFAFMTREQDEEWYEVPGPLPLTRRQAMANCERHAQEQTNE